MTCGLFNDESLYKFNNIKLDYIGTSSKAIFYFSYNDIYMNKIYGSNISCSGDIGDSSFILFDSGEDNKKLYINDMHIFQGLLNGSLIKIKGINSDVSITYSDFCYINTSGSVLENISNMVIYKY